MIGLILKISGWFAMLVSLGIYSQGDTYFAISILALGHYLAK